MSKSIPGHLPLHVQFRNKRRELDIKQSYLADKAGLDQGTVSRFESGKSTNIGLDTFRKLSRALDYYEWDLNLTGIQL